MNRDKTQSIRQAHGKEGAFLLRCARIALAGRKHARECSVDSAGLDWRKVLRLAEANRIVPMLASAVSGNCVLNVPPDVADRLRARFRDGAHRAMTLAGELKRVLHALDQTGIRCIPLKGPVLAAGSYRSVALRDFDDLDLLVPPADAARAAAVLARMGYEGWDVPEHRISAHLASECEHNLICQARGTVIDLHWAVYRRYFTIPTDFDGLWRRAGHVELFGAMVPDLSAEDAVLFLCFHGGKHLFHRLAWVCDVAAAVAAHPGLEWDRLLETATRAGARRLLLLGLCLAERLLGTRIPGRVHRLIRSDRMLHLLAAEVDSVIFQQRSPAPEFQRQVEACLFHLRVRERLSDRLRYGFWALAPNSRDWADSRLPAALDFLHALTRPVRLMRKHLSRRPADSGETVSPLFQPAAAGSARKKPMAFAS